MTTAVTTAAGLLRGLDDLFPVPPEHRRDDTDRASARQLLGCDDETLSDLVHCGLPASGIHGAERFDGRDLFNLGLRSRTGRTVPEQAFAYSLRWMRGDTETLLAPRRSVLQLRVVCTAPAGHCRDPHSVLALPRPELAGGEVRDLVTEPAVSPGGDVVAHAAPRLGLTATVHTRGELAQLRSPVLREVVTEFAAMNVRWAKLPDALQDDVDLVTSRGVATCASASRYLARRFAEHGFRARTRIGWVVGMLDLVHAWVEVADSDGVTKVVDPTFALFATTVPDANPLLADPTVALRTNRLIPTALPAGERVAEHRCAGEPTSARVTTTILPAPRPTREAR